MKLRKPSTTPSETTSYQLGSSQISPQLQKFARGTWKLEIPWKCCRNQTFLYHPQTEALLQWFEMGTTSNAIDGAFSYPNTAALTHSAVPCPH